MQILQEGRVDGVVMTALHVQPTEFLPLLEMDIPVVVQGPKVFPTLVDGYPLDSLHVNDVAAATTAVTYLIEKDTAALA
ncbi:MAG: LacI family transcriptional regulator [Anaerolineae bacterium]|nr:LacI family transcriptional regulator [Anaerolineae bacterium]